MPLAIEVSSKSCRTLSVVESQPPPLFEDVRESMETNRTMERS
jgi:hypothetical protein